MTCDLLACGEPHTVTVEHPDRGALNVCERHARNIERIGGRVIRHA